MDGYNSDDTLYYPDLDNPSCRIVELSNSVLYLNTEISKEELLRYTREKIFELNYIIYNTNNFSLLDDLFILKEIYFYLLYNY